MTQTADDQLWGEMLDFDTRSWTECFSPDELAGGPSPNGNSWWKLFEHCPHLFEIYHVLRKRPRVRSKPLEVGGMFHEARAWYYESFLLGEPSDKAIEKAFAVVDRCQDHVPHFASEVRGLLDGWMRAHGPGKLTDDRHETIMVEPLIQINLGFPYSSRLDRVIFSEQYEGPVIMEIKTASRRSESLLQSYSVDPQFLGQMYCWENSEYAKEHGPLKAFIVDLAVKGREQQFPREIVPISREAIHDWERAKRETWLQMCRCRQRNYWPRNRSNCVRWGRLCEAHEHCANAGIGEDEFPGFVDKALSEY